MEYTILGKSGIKVSRLCLGTWEFGQITNHWGVGPIEEYKKIVDFAIDNGINFIDTAEGYNKSEELLGEFLRGRRNDVVLATKISTFNWDYQGMRKSFDKSLARLQTNYIDLYQIHWPKIKGRYGYPSDMEEKDYEDIYTSMERLKKEGAIRAGGVCNFRLHHLQKFKDEAFNVIITDQVPYSLLWRCYDEPDMVNFCRSKGLMFLAYSSLAQGLLTGRYSKDTALAPIQKNNVLFNEPVYSRAMEVVNVLKEIAKEVDATPSQVALKWVIEQELIVSALVGVRSVEELKENIDAVSIHLTKEQLDRLNEASLNFWAPMPSGLELWVYDNKKENLEKIGLKGGYATT